MTLAAVLAALLLAAVHLLAGRLRFLKAIPRSTWLSGAGGVSVAYVFLHLLPELSAGDELVRGVFGEVLGLEEGHVYGVALVGLAAFYGLERLAVTSREQHREEHGEDRTPPGVFWIHVGSFSLYNALVGYLLVRGEHEDVRTLALFAVALALHFVVNDHGLEEHHREAYERKGRWVLAGAVLAGWGVGTLTHLPEVVPVLLMAFLAGGIVMNVLKEELPDERRSRFSAFLAGAAAYSVLLLAL